MKKFQMIAIILFVLIYLSLTYFDLIKYQKDRDAYLSDLNITIVDIPKKIGIDLKEIVSSNASLWDMETNEIILNREMLEKERLERERLERQKNGNSLSSSSLPVTNSAKIQKRIICLEKDCWEFMGLISINNKTVVSLLSRNKKKSKLKIFKVGDNLFKNLKIINLEGDSMILLDKEKEKKFLLKLFDINVSAYYQKNVEVPIKDKNE